MLSAVVYIVLRDGGDGGGGYGCRYLIQGIQDGVAVLRLNDGDTGCPVVSKVKRPDSRRVVGCSASSVADGGISRRIRGSPARGALPSSWICLPLLRFGSLYLFLSLASLCTCTLSHFAHFHFHFFTFFVRFRVGVGVGDGVGVGVGFAVSGRRLHGDCDLCAAKTAACRLPACLPGTA